MPYTTSSDGARIHYEVHGSGEPVLLIMGLGSNAYRWYAWFLYGEDTRTNHPERIEEDIEYRSKIPTQPTGYLAQLQAATSHDTWDELPSVAAPALVIHGGADLLVPTANGKLLAER